MKIFPASGTNQTMVPHVALLLLAHADADLEDMIAALCLVATVSHALRKFKHRDNAVAAAAEITTRLAHERNRVDAGLG